MDFQKRYDVVVAGGGIAGVAAAVAAARRGKKTALVEKTVYTGGLATTGLIYIYLPLCDGNGTQVTAGLAEELLKASIKYGPGEIPENWSRETDAPEAKRYRLVFSPASFILAMDEVLQAAGVDVWFDTVVCQTLVEGDLLKGVEVCNKSGRGILEAGCFVDATGDADLAHMSGLACPVERNALACWTLEYRQEDGPGGILGRNVRLHAQGYSSDPRRPQPGIDGRLVSDFILEGRERYRNYLTESFESGQQDRHSHYPLMFPAMAPFRMTRRIDGHFTLSDSMQWTRFEDSVGLVADWRKPGYVWEVPYRSLLPKGLKGLLAAGRCIASENDAWDVMRVIPAAALTGEAAGVAAALSVDHRLAPEELDVPMLQSELTQGRDYPLHFGDLGLEG